MPPRFFFPNLNLRLRFEPGLKSEAARLAESTSETFRTRNVVVRTAQHMTKLDIKQVLEKMYGARVERVNTLNVMGRRKRALGRYPKKENDYKKAYVRLAEEVELPRDPRVRE